MYKKCHLIADPLAETGEGVQVDAEITSNGGTPWNGANAGVDVSETFADFSAAKKNIYALKF